MKALEVEKEMNKLADGERARNLARFFKTGKGQYGEGDLFLGITVPLSRMVAHKYGDLDFVEIEKLLKNKYHEIRLVALLLLVYKYKRSKNEIEKKKVFNFYLKHTKYINNWDLVDLSAGYIVGDYLKNKDPKVKSRASRKILNKLVKSKNIWERRIAVIATFAFIYAGEFEWTFKMVETLMEDKHDLIQKACGWMLREVGKRVSEKELCKFLDKYAKKMPRTMLRYSIERLPANKRLLYSAKNNVV